MRHRICPNPVRVCLACYGQAEITRRAIGLTGSTISCSPPQAFGYKRRRSGNAIFMRRAPGVRLNLHRLFQVGKSHSPALSSSLTTPEGVYRAMAWSLAVIHCIGHLCVELRSAVYIPLPPLPSRLESAAPKTNSAITSNSAAHSVCCGLPANCVLRLCCSHSCAAPLRPARIAPKVVADGSRNRQLARQEPSARHPSL